MKSQADRARSLYKLSKSSLTVSPNLDKSATQLIQNLLKVNEEHNNSKTRNVYIVENAIKIYNETKEELKNYTLINSLLKIFSHFKQPEKISTVWNKINILANDNHAISYPLLFDCCMKSNPININDAIQCLEWMKFQNYRLHFDEMQLFSKNASKLITKCGQNNADIQQIKYIHSLIDNIDDIYIKTALINAYGITAKTHKYSYNVFESINDNDKNNVVIGAIMKVLIDHHNTQNLQNVLRIYDKYNALSLIDDISNIFAIKACILSDNFEKGKEIINNMTNMNNTRVNNVLIDFYSYFGDLTKAVQIFNDKISKKDVISVAALMKGYVNNNYNQQALKLYDDNITLNDDIIHVLGIKACISDNNFEKGQEIEQNLSSNHSIVAKTSLIDFYFHFGCIDKAENMFNSINDNNIDIVAVNAMMTGYIANNMYDKSLLLYDKYCYLHNDASHILGVKACTLSNNFIQGKAIHSTVIDSKYYTLDLKNVLIDFYGIFKDINNALQIFNSIPNQQKDIITINSMLKAYCNVDSNEECLKLFQNLSNINNKLMYDVITFSTALKACTQSTDYHYGENIHKMLKYEKYKHLLHENMIQTSLINMYGKCGMLDECKQIFDDNMTEKTELTIWNAYLNALGRSGDIENVEHLFEEMISNYSNNNITPDAKTYKILINSYSHSGYPEKAQNIWLYQIKDENIKYDPFVVSTLIDCFSRTGMIFEGYELLLQYEHFTQNINMDDVHQQVMWTSLLSGCKKHNDKVMAHKIDKEMKDRMYFSKQTKEENDNDAEDVQLQETKETKETKAEEEKDNEDMVDVNNNKSRNDSSHSTSASDTMGTASILMSNIFGAGADFDKVNEIRAEMKRRGWKKKPGFSEIDVYGTLHRFYAGWGYRRTAEYKIIDKKLEYISGRMEEFGYKRDYSAITRQLKDWETPNTVLNRHGEKLAVIYGLLTTQPDYLIVVNKNLRICVDCHNWMKMVSKIEQRKLIIADTNRVHSFEDGKCTCNDYW